MAASEHDTSTPERDPAGTDLASSADGTGGVRWKRALVAVGLTLLGFVANVAFTIPPIVALDGLPEFVGVVVLGELGFVAAAGAFLLVSRRGIGYLDRSLPAPKTLVAAVVGGALALFAVRSVVVVVATLLEIQAAPPSLLGADLDPMVVVLVMIPLSLLVVGPCEELLFRGVIQKYLDGAVSTPAAILGAGALFAVIHVPALAAVPSLLGTLVSLSVIFVVGLGFGWLYARTGSLPVAMGAHGLYNATIFASVAALMTLGYVPA